MAENTTTQNCYWWVRNPTVLYYNYSGQSLVSDIQQTPTAGSDFTDYNASSYNNATAGSCQIINSYVNCTNNNGWANGYEMKNRAGMLNETFYIVRCKRGLSGDDNIQAIGFQNETNEAGVGDWLWLGYISTNQIRMSVEGSPEFDPQSSGSDQFTYIGVYGGPSIGNVSIWNGMGLSEAGSRTSGSTYTQYIDRVMITTTAASNTQIICDWVVAFQFWNPWVRPVITFGPEEGQSGGTTTTTTTISTTTTTLACVLSNITLADSCGGCCVENDSITMFGVLNGAVLCADADTFQVDALNESCNITYSGGQISGVTNSSILFSGGYWNVSGVWVIPSVPDVCLGAVVQGDYGALWNGTPGVGSKVSQSPSDKANGSITFCTTTTTTTTTTSTTTTTLAPALIYIDIPDNRNVSVAVLRARDTLIMNSNGGAFIGVGDRKSVV